MAKMNRVYDLTIRTLSPLHIGSGNTLLRDYDFTTFRGSTWVIDEDALAERLIMENEAEFQRMADGLPATDLLQKLNDFDENNGLFRYVMSGEPRATTRGSQIQEQLKDAWDRPYIPGSSLKGALRTAVAFYGWAYRGHTFRAGDLGNRAQFAAQPMEDRVFYGKAAKRKNDPNHDIMRALLVRDSAPDDARRLKLYNVSVVTPKNTGSPIELEAIPNDIVFRSTLVLDRFLMAGEYVDAAGRVVYARDTLGIEADQRGWLANLAVVANSFTEARLKQELARWKDTKGLIRSFYNTEILPQVKRMMAEGVKDEFVIQLGWGGGWDSKTFGEVLTNKEEEFARVIQRYKNKMLRQGDYKPGDRYPKSRRLVMQGDRPASPLGWIHVKMEKRT